MTTTCEPPSTLSKAVEVDAIISDWLSFGRRSGSMEGASGGSLSAFSVPRMCLHVAAPLLIQIFIPGHAKVSGAAKCGVVRPCRNWMEQSIQFSAAGRRHLSNSEQVQLAETLDCPAEAPPAQRRMRLSCTASPGYGYGTAALLNVPRCSSNSFRQTRLHCRGFARRW